MIPIKNKKELELMKIAGQRLKEVVEKAGTMVRPGVSTFQIDSFIEGLLTEYELKAECKGYGGYPAVSCISVNDVIVHGVPKKEVILKSGDFVKIDVVGSFKGYCADMARGFFSGECASVVIDLERVARESFYAAFEKIRPGARVSDISNAVESFVVAEGFHIVKNFAGHGIGRKMHESPEIPNFGKPGTGPVLREGMALAVEPMITQRQCGVIIELDGWTARTSDGSMAGHFENTVLVTNSGAEIITE